MKIGIAGPIAVSSLKDHLTIEPEHLTIGLGGTALNNLTIGLLKTGANVSVYSLDRGIRQPIILRGENLTVFIGQYREKGWKRMSDFFWSESKQIEKFIRQDKPDIINAHWSYEFAIGAIKSNYPHLITFRDDAVTILKHQRGLYRTIRYMMDYWVRKHGTNFNVNSPYLQGMIKIGKHSLPVIPNPINDAFICNSPKIYPSHRPVKIVSVLNGWNNRKNPVAALKAFAKLIRADKNLAQYHLFGPGYASDEIARKWADENGLSKNVVFHGAVSHTELMNQLPDYDIMLHPAIEESFGNTLIEAMACGLPVIGGKSSGAVPWVLNYGKNGILVDVNSGDEMEKALAHLIADKATYETLSESGIQYVKSMFTLRQIAQQYLNLYQLILADDSQRFAS